MERNENQIMMNEEAFEKIMSINDVIIVDAIADAIKSFTAYVDVVDETETLINFASVKYEGEEYREKIAQYDQLRHDRHEEAIANASMLNRIAAKYNINDVFIGDVSNRYEVADFCLDITEYIFKHRKL